MSHLADKCKYDITPSTVFLPEYVGYEPTVPVDRLLGLGSKRLINIWLINVPFGL
jgi:hypothetical protein